MPTAAASAYSLSSFLPLIVIVALFVVMFYLPQRRRSNQLKKMLAGLTPGDEVVLSNGIMGSVVKVGDMVITLQLSEGAEVKVQRDTLTQILPKGTLKSL